MIPPARLLDPAALGHYEGWALRVRAGMGERPGDRRFPGRPQASGIEIESFADYAPGDDIRHLDWNAVGRLDSLLVRRFTAEREVAAHLVLDTSASMAVPAGDGKLETALELAMALGYVTLAANDALQVVVLQPDGTAEVSPVYRHRASAPRLAERLARVRARGALALGATLEAYARRQRRPGAAMIVSDFMMDPGEVERGVHALRARHFDVLLLHVIGARELEPGREVGRAVLQDVESGARHAVALTATNLARYRAALADHLTALETVASRAEAAYARVATDTDVRRFVTTELPRRGLLQRR